MFNNDLKRPSVLCTYSESHVLYAQFLHSTAIQLPEETHDSSFLPCSGGTVDQQVWEVTALHLHRRQRRESGCGSVAPFMSSIPAS